jgi:hypothetical protein
MVDTEIGLGAGRTTEMGTGGTHPGMGKVPHQVIHGVRHKAFHQIHHTPGDPQETAPADLINLHVVTVTG